MPRIAVLQMTSGIDPWSNFETIRDAAYEAKKGGAEVLFTPEMSLLLDRDRKRAAEHIVEQHASRYVKMLSNLAEECNLWIALGSMAVALPEGRWANRSMLFPHSGEQPVCYDKMHMFDVNLADGENWRESNAYRPGDKPVAKDILLLRMTDAGEEEEEDFKLGLTVCYDIRFPALFDALGREGCDVISIPAAFTVPTGTAHWHVLQRARAIEASAFVVAAAQVGEHADGRRTYGHSLVVDPWGEVLLDMGGEEPGLGFAHIDLARIAEVRAQVPSLANRREIAN
ncbi:carbon-nitrogen hydrolase family protein [Qipengyuania profunda]|jgi:predicted amidohydrolase|uniref:carbon-nitrogen hydrolase family protein n=1 Tax=Qipengyuania profunda TaxID=3113984 RepID=UPI002A189FE1|nr:carbon-nitrogen hydrolase family protein [Qipengyuania sp. HL-TH1]WPL55909.1 carbon-nitrogen hydrolase family protein [Qipengyuania sp. HL-TH5]